MDQCSLQYSRDKRVFSYRCCHAPAAMAVLQDSLQVFGASWPQHDTLPEDARAHGFQFSSQIEAVNSELDCLVHDRLFCFVCTKLDTLNASVPVLGLFARLMQP